MLPVAVATMVTAPFEDNSSSTVYVHFDVAVLITSPLTMADVAKEKLALLRSKLDQIPALHQAEVSRAQSGSHCRSEYCTV